VLPARLMMSIYLGLAWKDQSRSRWRAVRILPWPEDVRASAARAVGTTSSGGGGAHAGSSGGTHRHGAPGRAAADRRRVLRRREPRHGRANVLWWAPATHSPRGQGACVYEQRRSGQRAVWWCGRAYDYGGATRHRPGRFDGVIDGRGDGGDQTAPYIHAVSFFCLIPFFKPIHRGENISPISPCPCSAR
jgi:hypothetical protein